MAWDIRSRAVNSAKMGTCTQYLNLVIFKVGFIFIVLTSII